MENLTRRSIALAIALAEFNSWNLEADAITTPWSLYIRRDNFQKERRKNMKKKEHDL